jgi:hypothetical protein
VILPAFGLLISLTVISAVGIITLFATRWPGFRPSTLGVFIVWAYVGEVPFFMIYSSFYATPNGELTTRSSVIIMFAFIPVVAAISGWLGAAATELFLRWLYRKTESE